MRYLDLPVRIQLIQSAAVEVEFRDQDGPRACRNPEPIPGRYRAERTAQGCQFSVIYHVVETTRSYGSLDLPLRRIGFIARKRVKP